MKQTSRTAVVLSCSQQIPAEKSKKALSKPRKCDSELEKSKKMPSTSNFKPTLLDKKKSVAAACTQTDDIPEEFTFDDASCQTDPVTYEPSWSDVSCQTERSEEATKILLELLGPDYFDWRPKPKKTETPSVLQYDGAANSLTKKQEKCVMKQEDFVVKQQGDTDHDYAAAVTVTDRLLGGAVQVSVKEELDDNCSHAELPKSAVTVQTPVVQSAVSLKSSTFRPSPVIQATICMNSVTRQSPVINSTDITKGSAISQPPVAQTTVCTIPLLQRTTGKTASNPGCKEGKVGTKKRYVVTVLNGRPRHLGASGVDCVARELTNGSVLVPEKMYTEMKYDYKELAHLWKQLPLETKQALALADHRYLLTEHKLVSSLPGNSIFKSKGKLNRKLLSKYNPKTLKEIINVEGLPLYEDAPSLGEPSPAEVTVRLYAEDEPCSGKKGRGRGRRRKRKGAIGSPPVTRLAEKRKSNASQVCSTEKRAAQNDDYEPLQLEVTAEEDMNERFAKGPEYRGEEFDDSSTTEDSQEEQTDASEQEEDEWDQEPTEDEADYTDKTDKNDDDYTPWSENESSSESELEKASSSEMDLFSSTDSDSDSLSDCSLKEPVVEHNEDAPLTRRRRSQRLKKKCKPDAVLDQEEEEMDAESEDSAESKEEPGSVSLMCLSPKKYKCKYCSVKFRKKLWMKHHIHLTHLKIKYKPFKCSYENCKKRFILKKKMKEHIKNVHETASNPEEKEFLCGFAGCNKVFRSRQRLNIHVQIHSETRGWVCKECGKTFKLQKCLSMHTKIHTGEKRLQCTVCGELFRQKASLNWHMTKHEESCDSFFKVSCDVCGKKFEKEKGLEAHMVKVHGRTV